MLDNILDRSSAEACKNSLGVLFPTTRKKTNILHPDTFSSSPQQKNAGRVTRNNALKPQLIPGRPKHTLGATLLRAFSRLTKQRSAWVIASVCLGAAIMVALNFGFGMPASTAALIGVLGVCSLIAVCYSAVTFLSQKSRAENYLSWVREGWVRPWELYRALSLDDEARPQKIVVNSKEIMERLWDSLDGEDPVQKALYLEAARGYVWAEVSVIFNLLKNGHQVKSEEGLNDLRWFLEQILSPPDNLFLFQQDLYDSSKNLRKLLHDRIKKVHPDHFASRNMPTDESLRNKFALRHDAKIALRCLDLIRLALRDRRLCDRLCSLT